MNSQLSQLSQLVAELDAIRIHAGAIADHRGVLASPGGILLTRAGGRLRIAAVGGIEEIGSHPAARGAAILDQSDRLLTPGFANPHTHLDLTALGQRPFEPERGFVGWIDAVRAGRTTDHTSIYEAVFRGAYASLRGGVVAVGDIAGDGHIAALHALRETGLIGVSHIESFGLGGRQESAVARMRSLLTEVDQDALGVQLGLQPHAPYSAGPDVYAAALAAGREYATPLSTHLSETADEREFVSDARGALREFLSGLGLWNDASAVVFGVGKSPIDHVAPYLDGAHWTLAHVNDATDDDLDRLAEADCTVVYCPRAWRYFGHAESLGSHRWKEMRSRGVNVALGTDSTICLPNSERLSTLDEARVLVREEGADPAEAMAMITTRAARAVGRSAGEFELSDGGIAGLVAIPIGGGGGDALDRAMRSDQAPALLLTPTDLGLKV